MEQSRSQYPGFWFVCKYCQRVFRDKLELFCHQVNDHSEYREELNGQRNLGTSHDAVYTDPRPTVVEAKRHGSNFVPASQQHGWYPQAGNQSSNHVESQNYYTNPVEYYVVVPNQVQSHSGSNLSAAVSSNPVMNIPVVNQQIAHSSSVTSSGPSQSQSIAHGSNLVTLRNEMGNEWNKISTDSSDVDTSSTTPTNRDDLDYYCWKCKVKFGNAAAYIAHSSSCFPPGDGEPPVHASNYQVEPEMNDRFVHTGSKKRGRKPKFQEHQTSQVEVKKKRTTLVTDVEDGEAPSTSNKVRKRSASTHQSEKNFALPNSSAGVAAGSRERSSSTYVNPKIAGQDRSYPCTHCGLKFSSNDRLTSHLLQCKSKKNPYESYQYKCIKCSESFDIYLQYKRHIETHTGAIRYS